jgi:hypothetical protein
MTLQSDRELEVTRAKLQQLQQQVAALKSQEPLTHAAEISIQSLMHLVNQLKEEIARYESKSSV